MNPSDIIAHIQNAPRPLNKRDISVALKLKGAEPRRILKDQLRTLVKSGQIEKMKGGLYTIPNGLPPVTVIKITAIDHDGDVLATPEEWDETAQGKAPVIIIKSTNNKKFVPKKGDKVLARLNKSDTEKDTYIAKIIKSVDSSEGQIVGIVVTTKRGAVLKPANKKARNDFDIAKHDLKNAEDGDLVIAQLNNSRGLKRQSVKVVDVLAHESNPRAISILSLHEAGLNETFPDEVVKAAEGLNVPPLKGKKHTREDLRNTPLITIDGADARDFDDAVFAEKSNDGFHLIVAIADVSHYVRPGSVLDNEAQKRGNSTYFPDRVVPMLPEGLSNDLCSLRPNEDRASLAVHMWIDDKGKLIKHKFVRALIKSHARKTYEEVQHEKDTHTGKILDLIDNLYDAYTVLNEARQKRGALDLDMPEHQIVINGDGDMTGVQNKVRLDSHKLIEEFMILANVAAAQALESKNDPKKFPCVYRIHDKPSYDKLESAREFIESFDLSLPKGQVTQPKQINQVLKQAAELEYSHLISQVILRSQSQAIYSVDNIGHFGLALEKYAHFTSPIRRYADLLVHRALISAYNLGEDGISNDERARMNEICEHISKTERTSMEAERNATDRFVAAFLSDKIGATFNGKIGGVTPFGLFVTLDETGADGIIPMRSLKADFFTHNEEARALIGRRTGIVYRLGAHVTVRLKEASGLTGSTVFELTGDSIKGADIKGMELKPQYGNKRSNTYKKQRNKDQSKSGHKGAGHEKSGYGKKPHTKSKSPSRNGRKKR